LAAPESVICTTYQRALSARGKRPVDGGEEVRVREVQVPACGHDVGMAHQALDDVDVLATADEARRIAVAPLRSTPSRLVVRTLVESDQGAAAIRDGGGSCAP
jgi:hypothetical protein